MFNQQDLVQIAGKGIHLQVIQKQIECFIKGFPFIRLVRPAVAGDGIIRFEDSQLNFYTEYFDDKLPELKIVKFVPASGAASRMFKHLFEFREKFTPTDDGMALFLSDQSFNSVYHFITHIKQIAFYNDLAARVANSGGTLDQLLENRDFVSLVDYILTDKGLNYAQLPKAVLKFHQYPDGSRTAAEEHLVESAAYGRDRSNIVRIHFTISPEHQDKFTELFATVTSLYESVFEVKFEISFSVQKSSTDIIAVDETNQPVRNTDGSLLFRPGGHGALLENLNEIDADLIFIKNIDNIVPDHLKNTTFLYKKLIGGYLLFLKEAVSGFLVKLKGKQISPEKIDEIRIFACEKLFQDIPDEFKALPHQDQVIYLFKLLNRPIRVCGMVKNEGEPGGGPFWVREEDQRLTLQIVESSQIELTDKEQKTIGDQSTHFNPVDLVCCTRDFEGNSFNLTDFVNENTGFISLKSSGGKMMKAQELPGLWNGAMANWITIFIEVPIITFNPVKTVNDLLRKEHLPPQY
ncbi:MAG: DUF4301 family protein [Bacteroidales bacterium]|nr:DUF4301 family protein [Bacteroidales bacterium]